MSSHIVNSTDIDTYLKVAFEILTNLKVSDDFSRYYGSLMEKILRASQMTKHALIVSWFYICKYSSNTVVNVAQEENKGFIFNLIISSLILSNKILEDNCYSMKMWSDMLNSLKENSYDLKILLQLEMHFLAALDYLVSYAGVCEESFWSLLESNFDFNMQSRIESFKSSLIDYYWSEEALPCEDKNYVLTSPVIRPPTPITPILSKELDIVLNTPLYTVQRFPENKPELIAPINFTPMNDCYSYNGNFLSFV